MVITGLIIGILLIVIILGGTYAWKKQQAQKKVRK